MIRPTETGEIKAMVSKGFRNPTMREMYLYPPSNTDLEPERLMSYELSWRHRILEGRFSYGLNLYYIKADNIIQTIQRQNVNTGELENKGVEMEATWLVNEHWSVNTNHSYLDMKNPVVAAPTYKGYFGARFMQGKWSASAGLQQVCGLYKAVGENEEKETFSLLNLTIDYQLAPMAGFSLDF